MSAKHSRVLVKIRDEVSLGFEIGDGVELPDGDLDAWQAINQQFPGITVRRAVRSVSRKALEAMLERAERLDPTYRRVDFMRYFFIEPREPRDARRIARVFENWESVETARVASGPDAPAAVAPPDDPQWDCQTYLRGTIDGSVYGIGADPIRGLPGSDGSGIRLYDIELGFTGHDDMPAATVIDGVSDSEFEWHGQKALGIVAAVTNNNKAVAGIVPNLAKVGLVSEIRTAGSAPNRFEAILWAANDLSFGDVILIEMQTPFDIMDHVVPQETPDAPPEWVCVERQNLPVEIAPDVFNAIRLATALGIIVVEPAGNGSRFLDDVTTCSGKRPFDLIAADYQDSGAIMVGGSHTPPYHVKWSGSNYGSRVDCFAQAEGVQTIGDTCDPMTSGGGATPGTSWATAIIAGAAAAVQGMAVATLGRRLSPGMMRLLLQRPDCSTPSNNPAADGIGRMPNLETIATSVLSALPDVYVRDTETDTGEPTSGMVSQSPDIIVSPVEVADGDAAFGEGSGTESGAGIGSTVLAGAENYVYVRVRNRGGADATNVSATVFWSLPSTLVTPTDWTEIGTSAIVAEIPVGDVLTVLPRIAWPIAKLPPVPYCCLVALIDGAEDPAPPLAAFLDFPIYVRFIRDNNNVAWRNVHVITAAPAPQGDTDVAEMTVDGRGAPDEARSMRFEFVGKLPAGSKLVLEGPADLLRALGEIVPTSTERGEKKRASIPLPPSGSWRTSEVMIPVDARIPWKLTARLPRRRPKGRFRVYARQLWRGIEVGRVTFVIGSAVADTRHRSEEKKKKNRGPA